MPGQFYGILTPGSINKDRIPTLASTDPVHVPRRRTLSPLQKTRLMITVLFPFDKPFSKDRYYLFLQSLNIFTVECTCHKKGCLIFYGWYKRTVKLQSQTIELSVQRVLCKECGRTHALIPSVLVPYSQIPLKVQQEILILAETGLPYSDALDRNPQIDENNVKHIIRQYKKHWKERLLSICLSIHDRLTIPCLSAFSRQFMQIHKTPNILFAPPT